MELEHQPPPPPPLTFIFNPYYPFPKSISLSPKSPYLNNWHVLITKRTFSIFRKAIKE